MAEGLEKIDSPLAEESLRSRVMLALQDVYRECKGAFACVATVGTDLLVGFRDHHGIKPLILGRRANHDGSTDFMLASESVALNKLEVEIVRDIHPGLTHGVPSVGATNTDFIVGEVVLIDVSGPEAHVEFSQAIPARCYAPDIFELVYFARPESIMDGISVHECRQRLGHAMAEELVAKRESGGLPSRIDVVIPVPESGNVASLALANRLGVPFAFGLTRNGFCTRTFTQPSTAKRLSAVRRKLNVVESEFRGKRVLIVDDSIVRGNTSREIVRMARHAGAKWVTFASCSPAIRYERPQPASFVLSSGLHSGADSGTSTALTSLSLRLWSHMAAAIARWREPSAPTPSCIFLSIVCCPAASPLAEPRRR